MLTRSVNLVQFIFVGSIMNAMFEQIEIGVSQSMKIKQYNLSKIDIPNHYHPEVEIVLIQSSSGKVFVRNSMVTFQPGDLFIFGSNVPHLFVNDLLYHEGDYEVKLLVIQLHADLFEQYLFPLPELLNVRKLISNANAGIKLAHTAEWAKDSMLTDLLKLNGIERLIKLLLILDKFQQLNEFQFIDKLVEQKVYTHVPIRVQKVNHFLLQNYHRDITLDEISSIANMNKSAFCKFFKKHTNKTFSEFLNELRIDYASKLLIEGSLSISSIGYEVGYNSIPYFIRRFQQIKGISPKAYRDRYGTA